jgi:hypothetical protein
MSANNIFGKKFWVDSLELPPITEMAKQVGDIYHFTSIDAVEDMLNYDDNITLRTKYSNVDDKYFSFTRDPNLGTLSAYKHHVRLKLNGDKMSEIYRFEPYAAGDQFVKGSPDFEAEERINASKYGNEVKLTPYLEEIRIVPFEELKSWYGTNKEVLYKVQIAYQKIIDFAKEKNIPLKIVAGTKTGAYRREKLNENTTDMTFDEGLESLTKYFTDHSEKVTPLPKININNIDEDNSKLLLGRTAYYNPEKKEITLFTLGRHSKDILRSFAHEMIHHIQNLRGDLENAPNTTNTNEDDYLDKLEQEAYTKGNMTFRNWEDSLKN